MRDHTAFLAEARDAGCDVRPCTHGWKVLCPDGRTTITVHRTQSDFRAVRNMRAILKRAVSA